MAGETKWSPGPWSVREEHDRFEILDFDGHTVTFVYRAPEGVRVRERDRADAYLLGSAPDLYGTLAEMSSQHRCGCGHPACKNCQRDEMCAAALASARGES